MKNLVKRISAVLLVLLFFPVGSGLAKEIHKLDQKRNQLIGYIIDKELPAIHFSHKKMDESLSIDAFDLYLKQLDYQKRFLLSSDVTVLRSFAPPFSRRSGKWNQRFTGSCLQNNEGENRPG